MSNSEMLAAAMSVPETARFIGAGESTVWREIRRRKLAAKKLGSRTIVLRADAEKFLSELPSREDAE